MLNCPWAFVCATPFPAPFTSILVPERSFAPSSWTTPVTRGPVPVSPAPAALSLAAERGVVSFNTPAAESRARFAAAAFCRCNAESKPRFIAASFGRGIVSHTGFVVSRLVVSRLVESRACAEALSAKNKNKKHKQSDSAYLPTLTHHVEDKVEIIINSPFEDE
jgi:hypothetical protein